MSGAEAKRPILVLVDDEADVVDVLKDCFSDDFEVVVTTSPWTALQELKDRPWPRSSPTSACRA
ncbi:MAG: hypothetical protein IT382_05365 [Deltaproteobacteria bacterium]|nr:hypothetical protein [Deltaproteobacteria bacterium]